MGQVLRYTVQGPSGICCQVVQGIDQPEIAIMPLKARHTYSISVAAERPADYDASNFQRKTVDA